MIGQYLSITNENVTVSIFQKKLELNKALGSELAVQCPPCQFKLGPCLDSKKL